MGSHDIIQCNLLLLQSTTTTRDPKYECLNSVLLFQKWQTQVHTHLKFSENPNPPGISGYSCDDFEEVSSIKYLSSQDANT